MVFRSLLACLAIYAGFPTIVESQVLSDSKFAVSTITEGDRRAPPFVQLAIDHSSHSNTIRGAVVGATVGAAIGALIGYQQTHRSSVKDHVTAVYEPHPPTSIGDGSDTKISSRG